MGKFASFVRNMFLGAIVLFLAHLGYKLYIVAEELGVMVIKITEMNSLVRNLYELIKNTKFSIF